MDSLSLAVLCGGSSSRFGRLKQVEPVAPDGATLIDYSLANARSAGFGHAVFLVGKTNEISIRRRFARTGGRSLKREFVVQRLSDLPAGSQARSKRLKPWGTGHAVYALRHALDFPFAFINCDDYYGKDTFRILAEHLRNRSLAKTRFLMAGYALEKTLPKTQSVSRGVCSVENGMLVDIREYLSIVREGPAITGEYRGVRETLSGKATVSMNAWAISPVFFSAAERELKRFLETADDNAELHFPAIVGKMLKRGEAEIEVKPTDDEWFGLTHWSDLESVKKKIAEMKSCEGFPSFVS